MAIPVRLLAGSQSEIQTDLIVQSLDMAVERNVSAFPTPGNFLKRFAIDTNTPRVTLEMNGIITDDVGVDAQHSANSSLSSSPMKTLINFGNMLPTEPFSNFIPAELVNFAFTPGIMFMTHSQVETSIKQFSIDYDIPQGTSDTIVATIPSVNSKSWTSQTTASLKILTKLKFTGGHSTSATGALAVETTLYRAGSALSISSDAGVLGAAARLNIGDRVVNSAGVFLGDISALTDTSVTFSSGLPTSITAGDALFVFPKVFNRNNELVGYAVSVADDATIPLAGVPKWEIKLQAVTQTNLIAGDILTINQSNNSMEEILHNNFIKVIPSYWLEDSSRNPKGSTCDKDSLLGITSGAHIGIRFQFDASKTHPLLGGSDQVTLTRAVRNSVSQVPSASGHRLSQDAKNWDAVVNIPIKGLMTTDGASPATKLAQLFNTAFELSSNVSTIFNISGTGKTLATAFKATVNGSIVVIEQLYHPDDVIEHPQMVSKAFSELLSPQIFQLSSSRNVNSSRSAGDKVQDLIGLVSNSEKSIDMFRGLQIPYDSLVTSSGVTATARNFFLTFGSLPQSQKTSNENTRAASQLMNQFLLTGDEGGNADDDGANSWFEKVTDTLVSDKIQSIVGFFADVIGDLFVTIPGTQAHGNDGGIRIMPEKLHVRYDAGNNYYAFTMLLVATDFVIGV
jgi:hypothetical protein|tara:strand:+ start:2301 stop:4343 length:2043 start_codon:yes stop_codon:yes gene_type:complete